VAVSIFSKLCTALALKDANPSFIISGLFQALAGTITPSMSNKINISQKYKTIAWQNTSQH
jgi:hypothetical protein